MILNENEKQLCEDYVNTLIRKYYTDERLAEAETKILNRDTYYKEYGRGGVNFPRGFYCRSMLMDLYMTNIRRGKVLKRLGTKRPDYIFFYDQGVISLVSKNPGEKNETFEHIKWNQDIESSIVLAVNGKVPQWPKVCEATVDEQGRLKSNVMLTAFQNSLNVLTGFELYVEEYYYSDKLCNARLYLITSAGMKSIYFTQTRVDFIYDNIGKPQAYCIYCSEKDKDNTTITIPQHIKEKMNIPIV